ncbi:MAG: XrtA/PEP-CTERM system histidine kinase PrsK [Thioalkalivibrio sp.]
MSLSLSFTIGAVGYGVAVAAFLVLTAVLAIGWQGRIQGSLLVSAAVISAVWAAVMAWGGATGGLWPSLLLFMDLVRDAAWLSFLWFILWAGYAAAGSIRLGVLRGLAVVLLGVVIAQGALIMLVPLALAIQWVLALKVLLVIAALVLVEQLYRSTAPDKRWSVKYLCLGLGALFLYDFFLYSDALLFLGISGILWDARGYINALVVPLIAVSAARNPQWSLDVYVSRGVVLHGTTFMVAGAYLLVMAAAGYYLRSFGGEWGAVLQTVFLFAAGLLLVALLVSGQLRARLKVFLSKHFFNYRYDYREEWLRFIHTLARSDEALPERVIRAIGGIVESPGGQLWLLEGTRRYVAGARLNWPERELPVESSGDALAIYLRNTGWVIDLDEYRREPDRYDGLQLPEWVLKESRLWLIVPLLHEETLLGFVVLGHSRAGHSINWEDRDLLKTAGRQAASHLAQMQALQALAEARQFEAFNRLSAYVIHDLKNLIAQLSLVVSNARRHGDNPAFLKDAIATVDNAVNRMNRLMQQLRSGARVAGAEPVDLAELAAEAVANCAVREPIPSLTSPSEPLPVLADRDRLLSVLNHLIQNAQEATPSHGQVELSGWRDRESVYLEVADTGSGMDVVFIRERLFRPFDTTKGLTGMGIGVYESREFLRALGGELDVRSEPGQGSCFRLTLPWHVPDELMTSDDLQQGEA